MPFIFLVYITLYQCSASAQVVFPSVNGAFHSWTMQHQHVKGVITSVAEHIFVAGGASDYKVHISFILHLHNSYPFQRSHRNFRPTLLPEWIYSIPRRLRGVYFAFHQVSDAAKCLVNCNFNILGNVPDSICSTNRHGCRFGQREICPFCWWADRELHDC